MLGCSTKLINEDKDLSGEVRNDRTSVETRLNKQDIQLDLCKFDLEIIKTNKVLGCNSKSFFNSLQCMQYF